jgi:hypothetical protein
MARCQFCQREFSNDQGAKAHLRWCVNYSKVKMGTSNWTRAVEPSFDNAKLLFSQVQMAPDVVPSSDPLAGFLNQLTQQFAGPDETARVKQKRQELLADLCTRLIDGTTRRRG